MIDFTLNQFITLLNSLKKQCYSFKPFGEFIEQSELKTIILRHDVDSLAGNSLNTAKIEQDLGIRGSYYFRALSESHDEKSIKEIYSMGHEIGYHYEDLTIVWGKLRAQDNKLEASKEELEKLVVNFGIESFRENLERLRNIVPIKTICMHGSPMSRWDSRLLWKYYDYRDFGITGEPYFDINFEEVLYLTDTGRRWNGNSVNIRDKSINNKVQKEDRRGLLSSSNVHPSSRSFRSTNDIINAAKNGKLPDKIMMTFHPQRWSNKAVPWIKEFVWQNLKNAGKYFLIKMKI